MEGAEQTRITKGKIERKQNQEGSRQLNLAIIKAKVLKGQAETEERLMRIGHDLKEAVQEKQS